VGDADCRVAELSIGRGFHCDLLLCGHWMTANALRDFPPETKLGSTVEKPFGLFEERLHVRSPHMRAAEDLLAGPVFDNHQAVGAL
jgi:hypothetical protein